MVVEITVVVTSRVGEIEWQKGHRILSRFVGLSCALIRCVEHVCIHLQNQPDCIISVYFITYKFIPIKIFIDTINQRNTNYNNNPFLT